MLLWNAGGSQLSDPDRHKQATVKVIIYIGYTSAIKTERSKAGYHDFWSLNFNLNAQALYYRQYLERSLSTKCIWFWYKYHVLYL